jgi:CspA family cold shock protein
MAEGKVKWFNTRKGYGFIAAEDGTDIFVHYSNITAEGYKTLAEGDDVTFDVVEGEKGLRAENVVPKGATKSRPAPKAEAATAQKAKPAPKRKPAPKSKPAEGGEEAVESKEVAQAEETPKSESDASIDGGNASSF